MKNEFDSEYICDKWLICKRDDLLRRMSSCVIKRCFILHY